MKQILHKTITKFQSALLIVFGLFASISIASTATALAWGPDRPMFTINKPASHVTFNSITDNPAHGYEPDFMQIREVSEDNGKYTNIKDLAKGKEYVVYIYYHNNAASNYNASGVGVAQGAYAKAQIPAVVPNGTTKTAMGYVGASNAKPVTEVYDDIQLKNNTGTDLTLRYVPGSTTIHNWGKTNGMTMDDTITSSGVSLGYDSLNGILPGCNEYAGYITFRFKADYPEFTFSKQVRLAGTTGWQDSVAVKPGDKVEYLLSYKNTGSTEQTGVTLKDVLPKGINYVKGSSKLTNHSNPSGATPQAGDDIAGPGVNIGNYGPGANAYYQFFATVSTKEDLVCGKNTLTNTAAAETKNGNIQDSSTVTVDVECKPDECKPGVPKGDARCNDSPSVPAELPKTGPVEAALAVVAVLAITVGIVYWYKSRIDMRKVSLGDDESKKVPHPKDHDEHLAKK
ncbi:MAG: DUF11 domain-containing protein [Candidatus Nomurabacteria bacterium]|jgi:uncharacterized repeat protein (TIGR01451 family)|nr:DUF11 domain-containing protein [Candidatus Nomurabacteria bacterium]